MFKTICISMFLFVISLLPLSASAGEWLEDAYKDETLFVRAPASIGGVIGGAAGIVVGIPAGIVIGIVVVLPVDGPLQGFVLAPIFASAGGGIIGKKIGATVVGAPFYILQKTFYDFPRSLMKEEVRQYDLPRSLMKLNEEKARQYDLPRSLMKLNEEKARQYDLPRSLIKSDREKEQAEIRSELPTKMIRTRNGYTPIP